MARKANRTWATRSEAIAALAEMGMKSPAEVLAFLFNGDPEALKKEAQALQAGITARKQAEIARLQKEVETAGAKAKQA